MIDCHAHLCFREFDVDREAVVEACRQAGMAAVIASSAQLEEGKCVLELAKRHKGFVFASLGHHPVDAGDTPPQESERLIRENASSIVAIGEVGMDFHHEKDPGKRAGQGRVFEGFVELAKELKKPIVIHSWDAEKECFEAVKGKGLVCVFHCYTGPVELAEEIVKEPGFYISISTNIVFSKRLRKIAKKLPLERMVLETDSPFLDPDRERKRNTPPNIRLSAGKIAAEKGVPVDEGLRATTENARKVFGLRKI